jgi:hypothetical protein
MPREDFIEGPPRIVLFRNAEMRHRRVNKCVAVTALLITGLFWFATSTALAAISWDADSNTQWWFDPANWNTNMDVNTALPPSNGLSPTPAATDTQINMGTGSLPGGEGVVYDPSSDPNFPGAASRTFPAGYGPQIIAEFYLSRNTPNFNLLTIKGDLDIRGAGSLGPVIGRSSGTANVETSARVNQLSGTVRVINRSLDLGSTDTSNPGYGNGVWDYRGGILEVAHEAGSGLRLSAGGSAGTGGVGRFIMHNPTTPGYVRPYLMNIAAHAATANGSTNGVGIVEFHFENGGTRPIQVIDDLLINNGAESTGPIRSARLELVLDAAPMLDSGVPQNLGLFDVDFNDPDLLDPVGTIGGGGMNAGLFSNADGTVLYQPGSTVSAVFGATQYNWTITYTGDITWNGNGDTGVVASISESGGSDIVLIGLSSTSVGLPGDYNADGSVDAADYVVWRKTDGTQPGYNVWRTNFGRTAASGMTAGQIAAIPEPAALAIVLSGIVMRLCRPRRAA